MLMKNELLAIPLTAMPAIRKSNRDYKFAADAAVNNLPQSGKILSVDIYDTSKVLILRFFSDGKNFINYLPQQKEWNSNKVSDNLSRWDYDYIFSTKKASELVHKVINEKLASWLCHSGISGELDAFSENVKSQKYQNAVKRRQELLERHFSMFPPLPNNLERYCEKHIFPDTYFFISKVEKGHRTAQCASCGHTFIVNSNTRHRDAGICPNCKRQGYFQADWLSGPKAKKVKMCICNKVKGQLLIRWTKAERSFRNHKAVYSFYDYYRNLYLHPNGKPTIYAYKFMWYCYGGSEAWLRTQNGNVNHDNAYLYTSNLKQVFGKEYYHVDLSKLKNNTFPIDFVSLLNNLEVAPQTEYLFRLGLYRLSSELFSDELSGKTFDEVLGVSKQYLPLYQKYNISARENEIIRQSRQWVNENDFLKLRSLQLNYSGAYEIKPLLKIMSLQRLVNYFTKEKALLKVSSDRLFIWYRDYIDMSKELKIDMSSKIIRFPKNIKEAHDILADRITLVRNEEDDQKFREAVKPLYAAMPDIMGFQNDEFAIVLPQSRTDFIREGQSLHHCVGGSDYWLNHMKGNRMIFFIRHVLQPEKPFYTMEIDMEKRIILQLYGFKDCTAPSDVRKFANSFLKALKPSNSEVSRKVG